MANAVSAKVPFVGLFHDFLPASDELDPLIGPVLGPVHPKHANGVLPADLQGNKSQFGIISRILRKLLIWKLTGKAAPHPFFNDKGAPVSTPEVIR